MAKNQTYKAFSVRPSHVMDLNGVLLDSAPVLSLLATEVRNLSTYATFVARNDTELGTLLAQVGAIQPAEAGRRAGVNIPDVLVVRGEVRKNKAGKLVEEKISGKSRKERLFRHRVVTEYRAWEERIKAANDESAKYVSQGWKRTVNASPPSYGGDTINLGGVDNQYAVIENDPFADGEIILKMVIRGNWYRLIFKFDNTRFTEGNVTLPLIKIEDSQPVFIFSVVIDNPVVQFSGDYIVGVDVGINNYATVAVINSITGQIVYSTTLSQRVHSLWNSIRASEKQVKQLREKAEPILYDRQGKMAALDEVQLHRTAASRKKRELARVAAQEIAYLSHFFDNAVVAVEDLSWVRNTMQNGRWNRGELVKWLSHYVEQNGGWVVSVNAAGTSQVCHLCGEDVYHPKRKLSICPEHGEMDRDVNAAANIASRAVKKVAKARNTRANNRKLQPQEALKTPVARASLKYPGQDRAKNKSTPKRKKRVVREVNLPTSPARVDMTSVLADCHTPGDVAGTPKAAIEQGTITEYRLCSPI